MPFIDSMTPFVSPHLPQRSGEYGRHVPINHVPMPINMTPQKAASLLNKAARSVGKPLKGVGSPHSRTKGKGKSRVTKAVGRSIVGKGYSAGASAGVSKK